VIGRSGADGIDDHCRTIGRPTGLYHAMKAILTAQGVRGLFQGHLATLLRIFPYAGVKFMAYDKAEGVRIEGVVA